MANRRRLIPSSAPLRRSVEPAHYCPVDYPAQFRKRITAPLYGMMCADMAETAQGIDDIDALAFSAVLKAGLAGVQTIGSVRVGNKTLTDALVPAVADFDKARNTGKDFAASLVRMKEAAITDRDSTVDLVARIGRSARLGEQSRDVLDADATSCCLIYCAMADSVTAKLA